MNKKELVKAVGEKLDVTQRKATEIVNGVFEVVEEGLAAGKKVPLGNLGKLGTVERGARKGRNPSTQQVIDIPAKTAPKYFPSQYIKDLVK